MPNIIVNRRVVLSGSSGYEFIPESEAFFDELIVQPSQEQKIIYDQNLFRPLVDIGYYSLLDYLLVPGNLEQYNTVNAVNPTATAATVVNSPLYTSLEGWTGNGTTQYINTNFNAAINGVNFTRNDGCIGVYRRDNGAANSLEIGGNSATIANQIRTRGATNLYMAKVNSSTGLGSLSASSTDSRGLFHISRTGASAVEAFKNGVSVDTDTESSGVVPSVNVYFLAANANGVAVTFSVAQLSIVYYGSSSIDPASISTILNGYMTAIGKNVY